MYPLKYIGWMGVLSVLVFASEICAQQPELQRHLTRGKLWATLSQHRHPGPARRQPPGAQMPA